MSLSVVFKTNVKAPPSTFRPFLPGVVTTMELTAREYSKNFSCRFIEERLLV